MAKLDQANAGDNEVKLMMKHEWVRTSDQRSSTLPLYYCICLKVF